jgi:signal transduction histidine kinase
MRPDGIVETVDGAAPIEWLGHSLLDAPNVPEQLRDAARQMLGQAPGERFSRWSEVTEDGGRFELLVLEALPMRRTLTRVDTLVMRTLDTFVAQARTGEVDVTVHISPDVPPAMLIDGEKVAWALATVVGNALRFATLGKSPSPHVRVSVEWADPPGNLVISVADSGPGIPDNRAKWLFGRNPATGKSAGLALLMVRDVIGAHRGSVGVRSTVGDGTVITLTIPRL